MKIIKTDLSITVFLSTSTSGRVCYDLPSVLTQRLGGNRGVGLTGEP